MNNTLHYNFITAGEVAVKLGVTVDTVYFWARNKSIPHVRLGHRIRFDPQKLAQWIDDSSVSANPSTYLRNK